MNGQNIQGLGTKFALWYCGKGGGGKGRLLGAALELTWPVVGTETLLIVLVVPAVGRSN